MEVRRSLALFYALGWFGWPIGLFVFGGFESAAGATVIGVGCLLVLATLALELLLRRRDARRARQAASPGLAKD